MNISKKLFLYINLFSICIVFLLLYFYQVHDVLLQHDIFFVFKPVSEMVYLGRVPGKLLCAFFYQFIPSIFPNFNLNDIHNTIVALFKSLSMLLIIFFYAKFYFIHSFSDKPIIKHKLFSLLLFLLFFLLFSNYYSENYSFLSISESTTFFDWEFNLLFYVVVMYVIANIYLKKKNVSRKIYYLSLFLTFVLAISNEMLSFSSFVTLLSILLLEFLKLILIPKIKYLFNKIRFKGQLKLSVSEVDYFQFKSLFFNLLPHLFIMVLGILFYFFFTNYKTLENVGGGHFVDFREQIISLKNIIVPFIIRFYDLYVFRIKYLYLALFLLLIYSSCIAKDDSRKVIIYSISLLVGVYLFILLLVLGGYSYAGDFFIKRQPIFVFYVQISILVLIFLFGYIFNSLNLCNRFRFRDIILSFVIFNLVYSVFLCKFWDFHYNYISYLKKSKNIRQLLYNSDRISVYYDKYDGVAILPIQLFLSDEYSIYNIFGGCSDCSGYYDINVKIRDFEKERERSFLYTQNVYNDTENNTDNNYLKYLNHVYGVNLEGLVFVKGVLAENESLKRKFKLINPPRFLLFSNLNKINKNNQFLSEIKLETDNAWLFASKARLYRKKDSAKALENINIAISLDDNNSYYYLIRGLLHIERKEYKQAISDLEFVLKYNHNAIFLYYLLSEQYDIVRDDQGAINSYNRVITKFPFGYKFHNKDAFFSRGINKMNMGDYKGAINDFLMSKKISPYSDLLGINYYISDCFVELLDINNAIDFIDVQLDYTPEDIELYYDRGTLNISLKNYNDAILDFCLYLEELDIYEQNALNTVKKINSIYKKHKKLITVENNLEKLIKEYYEEYNARKKTKSSFK